MDPRSAPFWLYLSNWLREKGWTQTQLADAVGVHQSVVSKWLHVDDRRRTRPSYQVVGRLADLWSLTAEDVSRMVLNDQAAVAAARASVAKSRLGQDDSASPAVQSELEARLARLGATLSRYPRAVWLAVLDANERMADALAQVPDPPVSASEKGVVSAPIHEQTRGNQSDHEGFTLRKRLAQPVLA